MTLNENPYYISNPQYFNELKSLVDKHPLSYFNMLKANFCKSLGKSLKYLYDWIMSETKCLNKDKYSISTKVNWILNGLVDFPKCKKCGNTIHINMNISATKTYSCYCYECSRKNAGESIKKTIEEKTNNDPHYYEKIVTKRKLTSIERHNDPTWNNIDKNKNTCIDRYGVDNIRKSNTFKKYAKMVKKDKYGDENYCNSEKAKQTNRCKRNVDWPMQDHGIRKKSATKYTYDSHSFDSKAELCYYIWLKDNDVSFEYQPNITFQYEFDKKKHFYHPDFIVENTIIELKGNQFFKEDGTMQNPYDHSQDALYEAKHQCMLCNNVKIFKYDDYSKFISYVTCKYGKKFILSCKNIN